MGKRGRTRARVERAATLTPAPAPADALGADAAPDVPEVVAPASNVCIAFAFDSDTALAFAGICSGLPNPTPPENLHLTLAYCPDYGDPDSVASIGRAVGQWAASSIPTWGVVTGGAVLVGMDGDVSLVALVDSYALDDLQESLVAYLRTLSILPSCDFAFLPHVTLATGTLDDFAGIDFGSLVLPPLDLDLSTVGVAVGGAGDATVTHYPLLGPSLAEESMDIGSSILRSEEDRFTLAPLYAPGIDDTHGEQVAPADLQKACWDYFRSGDRDVRLQHLPDIVAGEVVELVTWPFPQALTLTSGDGTVAKVELPAGTVYEGVVWKPWAWEAVKSGKINGMSFGGTATKVALDA